MPLTVTRNFEGGAITDQKRYGAPGDLRCSADFLVTFDSSYPTGGEAIDLSHLFPKGIKYMMIIPNATSKAYLFYYDKANAKILVHNNTDGLEVSAATDLSLVNVDIHVMGLK